MTARIAVVGENSSREDDSSRAGLDRKSVDLQTIEAHRNRQTEIHRKLGRLRRVAAACERDGELGDAKLLQPDAPRDEQRDR